MTRKTICLLTLCVMLCVMAERTSASFFAEFIDVGAGDATLLIVDGETMLVDTGPENASDRVREALETQHIEKIDTLVITHPHRDHAGNLKEFLKRYPVGVVRINGEDDSSEEKEIEEIILAAGLVPVKTCRGDRYPFGGATVTALWPEKGNVQKEINDRSLVLMIAWRGFSLLMMGDAGNDAQACILAGNADLSVKADMIRTAHHGMPDGASWPFARAVSARWAVISCGEPTPSRPYLDPATVETLVNAGAEAVLSTLRNGSVTLRIDDERRLTITAEKEGSE